MMTEDEMFTDKNLLVLTSVYPDQTDSFTGGIFVKNQVAELKQYFRKIIVISSVFRSFGRVEKDRLCKDYTYNNVEVYYPRSIFPGTWPNKVLIDNRLRVIERTIEKHHLHFDLIHAHFAWLSGYAGAHLKGDYSTPLVVTGHGGDVYSLPFKGDKWREKIEYALNTADHVITVSQSNLACIKKLDVSTPVSIIPNGFRSDHFYPRDSSECRRELNLPQDKKIILTVGNLTHIKGQMHLVEAVQRVNQERRDILYVIVGAGELQSALERQIHSLGLGSCVLLAGGKPHGEIPLWMNACDLFALPSLNEGNPTVMFEALGCGKPFVGTRVGGVPEVISSDTYGLLVEPADPKDLAEKILIALDREWDREAILEYAERFTWENIAKEIMGVYRALLFQDKEP